MACDYQSIYEENERRYGTEIGRIGKVLMADRYSKPTHFIFELLQNTEDALARRDGWQGSRAVSFELNESQLRVRHFGIPFDESDVRAICSIAESTKSVTDIGRFGIGFKSVYALTDRPEIHSGLEAFAINKFVLPESVSEIQRASDETVIIMPLKSTESEYSVCDQIVCELVGVRGYSFLFLRQIEEIRWKVENGQEGILRRKSTEIEPQVRQVTAIRQEKGQAEIVSEWLVFSRPVYLENGKPVGHVELAFGMKYDEKSGSKKILSFSSSPLVVVFPTVVETHCKFLIQGPYRTTLSRDNIPPGDSWNIWLVEETATLLTETLVWLKDNKFLNTAGLSCLPLESEKFPKNNMFAPLFDATKSAFLTRPLLPRYDVGHVSATNALIGRTQELRELFTPEQLALLYKQKTKPAWLSREITPDRTPLLHQYLVQELNIREFTPDSVIRQLDWKFLEKQQDDWIRRLYEFMSGQPGLQHIARKLALIRLENGNHTVPFLDDEPQAFLPSQTKTDFPVVRPTVCNSDEALKFLKSLGLKEPDPVDDAIRNVIPTFRQLEQNLRYFWRTIEEIDVKLNREIYKNLINRLLNAFDTDSKRQRDKLLEELNETPFVMAADAGDSQSLPRLLKPSCVYVAKDRMKDLFEGVSGVWFTDYDRYPILCCEKVNKLLKDCGADPNLRLKDSTLTYEEQEKLRTESGYLYSSGYADTVENWTVLGLEELINALPSMEIDARRFRTKLLWEELASLTEHSEGVFTGEYSWSYNRIKHAMKFDATFVRMLNESAWVPDEKGNLQTPGDVEFDTLDWEPNLFLQSKIQFKPSIINKLAKEAGIEPDVLDLLRSLGLTNVADLKKKLGIKENSFLPGEHEKNEESSKIKKPPEQNLNSGDSISNPTRKGDMGVGRKTDESDPIDDENNSHERTRDGQFISYIHVHSEDKGSDTGGQTQEEKMKLERNAIEFILSKESDWKEPTKKNNRGFDLFQGEFDENPKILCEVKAISGPWKNRSVTMSDSQFEFASKYGDRYWLYVVEWAETSDKQNIIRIQNPAGKAKSFAFDHGWREVAESNFQQ